MTIKYLDSKRIRGSSTAGSPDTLGTAGNAVSNDAALVTSGHKLGTGCLDFDGSEKIVGWNDTNVSGLQDSMDTAGSISMWFNADQDEDSILVAFCQTNANTKMEVTTRGSRKLGAQLKIGGTQKWEVTADTTYNTYGNWNHVVLTHNGTLAEIYINGSLATMTRSSTTDNSLWWTALRDAGANGIAIGSKAPLNGASHNEFFEGKLDDIGIWDRALTSSEVSSLYNSGTGALCTTIPSGLKVYYSCDSATVTNEAVATDEKATLVTTGKENWTEMDSSKIAVNTSTGKIDFEMVDGSIDNVYYPITVEDDTWQLRAIVNFTSGASANSNTGNQYFRFGFATLGTEGGSSEPTEGILTTFQDHGGGGANEKWHLKGTGGSTVYSGTDSGTTTGVDYYLTLKRTSTTAISVDIKTVSHSGSSLTGFPLTTGVASGTDGLAYLFIANGHNQGSDITALSGTIRAIQVWTDSAGTGDPDFEPTLLAGSNLPENTLFEETDTYKTWWLQDSKWKGYILRGCIAGGNSGSLSNVIDYITIASAGDAADFGDINPARRNLTGLADATRGCFAGGYTSSNQNNIEYITVETTGNTTDFGDLDESRRSLTGLADATRGCFAGGWASSASDKIDYITIQTTGNAADFGNLTHTNQARAGFANATRGVWSGGDIGGSPGSVNTIDYITIQTTGNATDFGDLTEIRAGCAGVADKTRGVTCGGSNGTANTNTMDYITIDTTGNATDFGDLTTQFYGTAGCSDLSRGCIGGGSSVSTTYLDSIDYITIATTGNGTDFGDLTLARHLLAGLAA